MGHRIAFFSINQKYMVIMNWIWSVSDFGALNHENLLSQIGGLGGNISNHRDACASFVAFSEPLDLERNSPSQCGGREGIQAFNTQKRAVRVPFPRKWSRDLKSSIKNIAAKFGIVNSSKISEPPCRCRRIKIIQNVRASSFARHIKKHIRIPPTLLGS